METTLILWLWPVVVLGSVALFVIYLTRKDDAMRDKHPESPAE